MGPEPLPALSNRNWMGQCCLLRKCISQPRIPFLKLSEEGRMRRRTLELIDGRASLEDIARQLAAEFPERFTHWHRALSYAANIANDDGR